jgi:hypothetical protein
MARHVSAGGGFRRRRMLFPPSSQNSVTPDRIGQRCFCKVAAGRLAPLMRATPIVDLLQ